MFRHLDVMVGDPKTLYDLRKVEASVRVTCRSCDAVKLHDLEETIARRLFDRKPMDWRSVQRDLPCPRCPAGEDRNVKVDLIPFGRDERELRERRAATLVMNLALTVLKDAAQRALTDDVATPAVRLALRVLRPFLADRAVLVEFWAEITAPKDKAYHHAHLKHRWLVGQLVKRGHAVWAEFR